ncbi:MAG TPA: sulfite exporter TauE/SafE family protein [Planctomycetota bacterium]|nr:sulfite exporter TauE/SafE family protein [Planctomycetota bacterium]
MVELLVYALVGLTAGVLGSMLGVGGGILMVPAMVYFCGVPFKPAAAMSLAVMIPMAMTSTIRYLYNPEIRPGMKLAPILLMAVLAIAGAFLGTEVSRHLSGATLKKIFAVIMVVMAVKMFFEKDKPAAKKDVGGMAAPAEAAEGAR